MTDAPPQARDTWQRKHLPKWGCVHWLAIVTGLALVATLILPPATSHRESGPRTRSQNQLKHLGLAAHNYHAKHGSFPPHVGDTSVSGPGNPAPSWQTAMLPYMDEVKLWRAYDGTKRFDDPANAAVVATEVATFIDPHPYHEGRNIEGGFGLSHFAGNVRVLGEEGAGRLSGIRDGTTQTILAGQIGAFPKPWADPSNLRDTAAGFGTAPQQFGGPHPGGGQVAMCDGSVIFISETIDPAIFAALGTPAGGERLKGGPYGGDWTLDGE
ncbi:DUF1559 domain-containing protein [Alienimonas chondri]|uniref:DUF1559 domain-containing protein n=1 Tax=Alienimonas chondri TaxID=2681879 RepID=A0ABX1VI21_9PLAN|nr:DUF1559 domain-containing protein [Alienimonas chondri]NNJ26446.1 hypothetical protein [Alienimonas chondri]